MKKKYNVTHRRSLGVAQKSITEEQKQRLEESHPNSFIFEEVTPLSVSKNVENPELATPKKGKKETTEEAKK
ncbi:MAG: hypothetical protein ACRBFS_19465 [Aureispira sp.]